MKRVNINVKVSVSGRPKGSSKKATKLRNSFVIRAYWKGSSIATISKAFGISKNSIYKIIATSKV